MRWKLLAATAGLALVVTACPVDPGGGTTTTTTSTTTTTLPIRPTLNYSGTADKTAGCFSGLLGDDTFQQTLGTDGWWHFGFQGCSLGASETVALIDPAGGPTGDAFQSPTGYQCQLSIDGTGDATAFWTTQIGTTADTGGRIILDSTNAWPDTTTWKIVCEDERLDMTNPPTTTSTTSTTTSTTTTSTTTTTAAPLPTLDYTGVADKAGGCFSGLLGDDTFQQALGTDGWWHFGFQGCSLGATETVALIDPAGGPTGDAFQSPTGYACKLGIDGTSDATGYNTNQIGSTADTGGRIILSSTNAWPDTTTWRITCVDANTL